MIQTYQISNPWSNRRGCKDLGALLIFFFIWPFGAWLYSLYEANKRSSYVIFFMFSLLLCWHMSPVDGAEMYDDFIGIMQRFQTSRFSTYEIVYQIQSFFTFSDDAPKELYENIVIWIVKGFTDNYHFYFLICAIPVAYCQLKSLKRITQDVRYKPHKWFAIAVMIMFIFPRDIITVQNPRFTTGFWICVLCSLNYFCDEKKNILKILPILITPLIHSGMWLYAIIVGIYLVIPKRIRLLEIIAIISIPFTFLDSGIFHSIDLSAYLPEFLYKWSLSYLGQEQVQGSGFWWIAASFTIAVKVMYIYMTWMMIKEKEKVVENVESKNFYPFYLLLFTIVNVMQSIPVLGERYYWFVKVFAVFVWFKAFFPSHKKVIFCLLAANLWGFVFRYGYVFGGALSVTTPIDVFITPLPYLMGKGLFW